MPKTKTAERRLNPRSATAAQHKNLIHVDPAGRQAGYGARQAGT